VAIRQRRVATVPQRGLAGYAARHAPQDGTDTRDARQRSSLVWLL